MYLVKINKYTGAEDENGHKVRTVLNINGIDGITLPHDTEIRLDVPDGDHEAAAQYLSIGKLLSVTEGLPTMEGEKRIIWGAGGHKVLVDAPETIRPDGTPKKVITDEAALAANDGEEVKLEKGKIVPVVKKKGK